MTQKIPLQNLQIQNKKIKSELEQAFSEILDSGQFVSGKKVKDFEDNFANFIGTKHSVGVSTGSSALEIALKAAGIGQGDEVIVPSMTFIATIEAVLEANAIPVLVDIDRNSWNISPNEIIKNISNKTRAIVPVHLHGRLADMNSITKIAEEKKLIIIEDAAQAHGASRGEFVAGATGLVSAFSFYPGKNLGALGEAGALTTNSQDIFQFAVKYRNYGSTIKYEHEIRGNNYRMDEIQAAFLNIKLKYLNQWTNKRIENANIYDQKLDTLRIEHAKPDSGRHVYHIYAVLIENRNQVLEKLINKNIYASAHYPISCHQQMGYKDYVIHAENLENSELIANKILSLPLDENISADEIDYVCRTLSELI